jgi:hypothetical protein
MITTKNKNLNNLLDEDFNLDSRLHFHPAGSISFSNNEYAIEFDNNIVYCWNKITGLKKKYFISTNKIRLFNEMYNTTKKEVIHFGKSIKYLDETHYVISGNKAKLLINNFNNLF